MKPNVRQNLLTILKRMPGLPISTRYFDVSFFIEPIRTGSRTRLLVYPVYGLKIAGSMEAG